MSFEIPNYLYLMPVAMGIIACIYWATAQYKKHVLRKLGEESILGKLIEGGSNMCKYCTYILIPIAFGLAFVALANPRMGFDKEVIKATSSDIYIAFDISNSMMARDIAPSRLDRAKRFTQELVDKLKGNRIGLIYFAGTSFTQMPLTSDYAAVKMALSSAHPQMAGTQGTDISDAIKRALNAYDEGDNAQRALIIITDGEDHDASALALAEEAKEKGMEIFTVGVGTEKGELVPEVVRGIERYKKDQENKPVVSKLNIELITSLAKKGGGQAYMIGQGSAAIADIDSKMKLLEKQSNEQESFTNYKSYFQYILSLALVLFLIDWLMPILKRDKV